MDNFESQTSSPAPSVSLPNLEFENAPEGETVFQADKNTLPEGELNEEEFDLMSVPGTPHDKLTSLAKDEPDEEQFNQPEEDKEEEAEEVPIEQQIMQAQNEVLELLINKMGNEKKDMKSNTDANEMLKMLKKLLEKLKKEDEKKQSGLMGLLLALMLVMFSVANVSLETVEEESKKQNALI